MAGRLIIIDGKSIFYRGYYAMPGLTTKDGTPVGGVYGFAVMALEVVKRLKPDYVCVAWDKSKTNIRSRRQLYPQYKANRKPPPPDFYSQIPILHQLLESLGWPLYEMDDFEADDIMGVFAKQAGKKGIESYLITSDLDVLQLINSHTHIYTLKKGLSNIELFNESHFKEKYGISPYQFVDVKALKGDNSDNIPGVAGVGEKTALDLISKYETLDGVYKHLSDLKPTLRNKLEADKEMAYLSKKLVTLIVDAPFSIDLEKAKIRDDVPHEFISMLRKLEFRSLLKQIESRDESKSVEQADILQSGIKLFDVKPVAFVKNAFKAGKLRVLAINPEGTELWVSTGESIYSQLVIDELDKSTIEVLANGPVIGHDLKTIFRSLLASGYQWNGIIGHDTRIGAFLLNSLVRAVDIADYLGRPVDIGNASNIISAIWIAYRKQSEELSNLPKLEKLAQNVDFPMIYLLALMEHRGMKLDSTYLNHMSIDIGKKIKVIESKIYAEAGQDFNISSPSQLGMILYEKLNLPTAGVKKGKTGFSTGAKELAKLRGLHPVIDLVSEYREYTKLKSTYIDTLPKQVDKFERIHTTFTLDVAATGRLSSHDPNLQNIPTRTEIGQAIRKAFIPEPGKVFVSADYNQFELRLSAVLADDKDLLEDFNNDVDVHSKIAAQIYGVPISEVDKNMRRHAKVVNFGILYGMSPHGLSIATGMDFADAKKFITKYFELRAPIQIYIEKTVEKALKNGYVETIFGRRRPTPDLRSSNFAVREAAKRAAMNMPIQGTEADLMKMSMLEVEKKLGNEGMQIMQVHDSILVECDKAEAIRVSEILKSTMEGIHPLPVHLKVDISTGNNWGEL